MNTKEVQYKIPILTYHSIDNSGSVISTSPEKFRSHMQYLSEFSFNVISLEEIVSCIHENRHFPHRSVAITFDDGFKNNYDIAYPVLKVYGFKATIFLVTGYCGRNNRWQGQPAEIPELDLLQWDEIKVMASNGIDFGAHTVNHPNLAELTLKQAEDEIVDSKKEIEERLGKNISHFAYPYGGETGKLRNILKDEFQCAVSTELNVATLGSDIYSLPRIDMYYFSRNNYFTCVGTSNFSHYIRYRKFLRTLRTFI
ncbi:MAG: polysaccharide deacetylase family protein [Candidatus Scalindua sp.]|nr:polysaccharide deacetylase family protein [Candidatus Scalindua sp.]